MYFPTTAAKLLRPSSASTPHDLPALPSSLAGIAKLGGSHDEVLLSLSAQITTSWRAAGKGSRSRKLAASITGAELGIWSIRPSLLLCKLRRTPTSLRRYGANKEVVWIEDPDSEPGQCNLIVLTTKSFLFFYSITALGNPSTTPVYAVPATGTGAAKGQFVAGSGEAAPLPALVVQELGNLDFSEHEVASIYATPTSLLLGTLNPPAIHTLQYSMFTNDINDYDQEELGDLHNIVYVSELSWIIDPSCYFTSFTYNSSMGLYVFLTSDGRAYAVKDLAEVRRHLRRDSDQSDYIVVNPPEWDGQCFYGKPKEPVVPFEDVSQSDATSQHVRQKALCVAFNQQFSLVALGLQNGQCALYSILTPSQAFMHSHQFSLRQTLKSTAPHLETGSVSSLAWTSDGYALAVGWKAGWSVWTVYGKLTTWAVGGDAGGADGSEPPATFEDRFMYGVSRMFWGPSNMELFVLCEPPGNPKNKAIDEQFFVVPFAKSAVTSLHTPDNTNHAFLQLDDGVLVYRGADQPDMSVINPESDVWQHIKIPASYVSNNWPVRYACISSDARLLAVAGRRGFTHYNSLSGRWKLFDNENQEQSFRVQGGMLWYGSSLIVATEEEDEDEERMVYKLCLFARDRPLNTAYLLDEEVLPSQVILTSLFDSSLLVYTADNTFYHYLLTSGKEGPSLRLCGSIGFEGVVSNPRRVRGLSWMVPRSQQRFGDPSDDLNFATVIFLIEGKLVLLRPRRAIKEEVRYDMQILADRIEFYWTHLAGIGTLENSLWGWDGEEIRVWLNALTIDTSELDGQSALGNVEESLAISVDFYPLSVLMDKGIIVGVEHETSYRRSLDFAIFRLITNTHLFIHHVLRFHLSHRQTREAVIFASHYQHLVYFAHALEILLHAVLEDEADALPPSPKPNFSASLNSRDPNLAVLGHPHVPDNAVLPVVVDFLDHFKEALRVVVNCARKTEITRWAYLFQFVGKPRDLFERCMTSNHLKTAASYLLVLHNLEPIEQSSRDTVRLLKVAMAKDDWQLCQELSRFLYSLDHTGAILQSCLAEAGALPASYMSQLPTNSHHGMRGQPILRRAVSTPVTTMESAKATSSSGPVVSTGNLNLAGKTVNGDARSTSPVSATSGGSSSPTSFLHPTVQPAPFQRTGSTARNLHYRMSSGSGLGLGNLYNFTSPGIAGTPPSSASMSPSNSGSGSQPSTGTLGQHQHHHPVTERFRRGLSSSTNLTIKEDDGESGRSSQEREEQTREPDDDEGDP